MSQFPSSSQPETTASMWATTSSPVKSSDDSSPSWHLTQSHKIRISPQSQSNFLTEKLMSKIKYLFSAANYGDNLLCSKSNWNCWEILWKRKRKKKSPITFENIMTQSPFINSFNKYIVNVHSSTAGQAQQWYINKTVVYIPHSGI